jgi:hypothetical protein
MMVKSDTALAVFLFLLIILSLAAVVWMLNWRATDQSLTLMGGLSGATTALIALMLRATESPRDSQAFRFRRIAALLPYPAGFLAGAFSVLAAIAFLGIVTARASMSGAAMIGGLYGLVLGAYWAKTLESAAARETLLAPTLAAVEGRFLPSTRTNWSGRVLAYARRMEGDIIVGELKVWFEPKPGGGKEKPRSATTGTEHDSSQFKASSDASSTDLTIQDGSQGTHAEFVITISGGEEMVAFPRRQVARVPTDTPSEQYQFKLLANREKSRRGDRDRSTGETHAEEPGASAKRLFPIERAGDGATSAAHISRPILIDISMAGRTVQVIETHLK